MVSAWEIRPKDVEREAGLYFCSKHSRRREVGEEGRRRREIEGCGEGSEGEEEEEGQPEGDDFDRRQGACGMSRGGVLG